jgi:two-component system NtrC family sensor kinase
MPFTALLIPLPDSGRQGPALWAAASAVFLLLALVLGFHLWRERKRSARLAAVQAISGSMAQAHEGGDVVLTALEEIRKLLAADAIWYRTLHEGQLLITHQIGVSEQLLREHALLDAESTGSGKIIRNGTPALLATDSPETPNADILRREGFRQLLILPVKGKSSAVGAIAVAHRQPRAYPDDELQFLSAVAGQIGIAIEHLDLLHQVLRSHQQWVHTVDAIEDSILVHDAQYRVLRLNRALLLRLGVSSYSDIVLRCCEDILPGAGERWRQCPYCGNDTEFNEGPDPCFGGFSIVTSSSFTDEGVHTTGTIHIIRDTTRRRVAEDKYRLLFEQAQEGVFVSTPEGKLLDCNHAFVRMLGYDSREQVLTLDVSADLYVDPTARERFLATIAQHGLARNLEVELRRRDGSSFTALENSFAERDAAGNILCYQGFLLDISEIKRAEDEIRRRNRELHALNAIAVMGAQSFDLDEIVGNALRQVVGLFAADTGGVWLIEAPGSGRLQRRAAHGHRQTLVPEFSFTPEFVAHLRAANIEAVTEEDWPRLPEFARRFAAAEGLVACAWVVLWSKDQAIGVFGIGSRTPRKFSSTDLSLMVAIGRQLATTIEKVRLYQETHRAYHDLQHTQEQLLQSEKMSAIGQLVSGVAHELNNPLTAILGYAELLQGESMGDRAHDFTAKLVKQTQRTQRLVQNLLSFARQRKPERKLVDVRRVLEETIALREYDLERRQISVDTVFESGLPGVIGDAHQMEQVFLNIINNAVDAMLDSQPPGSETGRFDTRELMNLMRPSGQPREGETTPPAPPAQRPGPHRLRVSLHHQDGRVCAEFQDNGPGIREPSKVFDPFYTTKSVGKGTGLGLSICYGIVKEHGGEISAHNAPEGGALFRILLPAAPPEAEATSSAPVPAP